MSATVPHPAAGTLTGRESEILALVREGLMNKQIARRLGISLSTVKNHVHRILQKPALPSRDDGWGGRRPGVLHRPTVRPPTASAPTAGCAT